MTVHRSVDGLRVVTLERWQDRTFNQAASAPQSWQGWAWGHYGVMISSGTPASAGAVRGRAAWLLVIGMIIAGLFGMHVLGAHGPGQGNTSAGMVMGPTMTAAPGSMAAPTVPPPAASIVEWSSSTLTGPVPGQPLTDPMAGCVLFLVTAAGLLLALLLARAARQAQKSDLPVAMTFRPQHSHRWPPNPHPLHLTLCVARI